MKDDLQVFIPAPTATGKNGKGIHAEHAIYTSASGERLYWSAPFPLPAIRDRVVITMNSIGPAIVRGYFSQHGYLGVLTFATKPPKWLREQNKRDAKGDDPDWIKQGIGCEFGSEIALPKRKGRAVKLTKAEAAAFNRGGGTIDTRTAAQLLGVSSSEVTACLKLIQRK